MTFQPFEIIVGLYATKYLSWFVSDSCKKDLPDRKRYQVMVEIAPGDKLVSFSCECENSKFNKGKICRHISNDDPNNPGLLQILKIWKEIDEIPKIEENGE